MNTEVIMPQISESIIDGTIVRWLKKVGDHVERDEALFEISTDKVDAEIPSPVTGTLTEIRFKEGDKVEVNTVVAVLDSRASTEIGAVKNEVPSTYYAGTTNHSAIADTPPEGTTRGNTTNATDDTEELRKEELQRRMEEARESVTQTVSEIKETATSQYQTVRESISDCSSVKSTTGETFMICNECGETIESPEGEVVFCPFCGSQQPQQQSTTDDRTISESQSPGYSLSVAQPLDEAVLDLGNARAPVLEDIVLDVEIETPRDSHLSEQALPPLNPISETPERMRDLVRDVLKVVDEYQQTINAAIERRKNAQQAAQNTLNSERKAYEQLLVNLSHNFKSAESEYDTLRNQLGNIIGRADEHMKKQRVEAPLQLSIAGVGSGSSSLNTDAELVNVKAKVSIGEAEQNLQQLLTKHGRPVKEIFPNNQAVGCLGLVGAFAIGLWLGVMMGSIAVFFFASIASYAAFMIYIHVSSSSNLREHYNFLLQIKERAESYLEEFKQKIIAGDERARQEAEKAHLVRPQIAYERAMEAAAAAYTTQLAEFKKTLRYKVKTAHERCAEFSEGTAYAGANWLNEEWSKWTPTSPASSSFTASMGTLNTHSVNLEPSFSDINLKFSIPALVPFSDGRCLLFNATGVEKDATFKAVQSVMLRLLANVSPGKVRFTFLDPVGLGQNVAAFMPLGDYDESLISSRAWTEPQHIEQRLADLTEHMETVIQKYLRNEFPTIEDYNKHAGEVAEPYRVLVVLDFPVNFSDSAARRLVSIARNGPRCGVYTIVVRDAAKEAPYGFNLSDLEQSAHVVEYNKGAFVWKEENLDRCFLSLDEPPKNGLFKTIVKTVGEKSKDAMKVEVPYNRLLEMDGLTKETRWQGSTRDKLQVPLGPSGARKLQYLTFGQGTAHHAIVIGRTGSGKSNLMHVIVTTLALAYSPEEIQLYLIDFKQGVEFRDYAKYALPHARVIAIESEREFGLSVLQGLDAELLRRGEMFRVEGVNSISSYRQKKNEKLPRILLLVDEFQEFFTQSDNISRQASLILDRLVRQGRYAGVHVMLGSQNLGGGQESSLPHSTINQMGIRIALQCSESDARQIMADDNPAARLLSRPGEAIYNAASGLLEGNNLFQVARFTDEDRATHLEEISSMTLPQFASPPIVFEGNEPARLEDCQPLNQLLNAQDWTPREKSVETWIGEPVALRPPTSVRFRLQSGSHLLVITREEEEGVGTLTSAILGLAAQEHPDKSRFYIADFTASENSWSDLPEVLSNALPHKTEVVGRRDMPKLFKELVKQVNVQIESSSRPGGAVYIIIQGMHLARDLRLDEDSYYSKDEDEELKLSDMFATLLREGPEAGVHILAWSDTYANAMRVLNRKMMREFSVRVAGTMSNEDSQNFIEDAAASKLDKPHRAIFFQEDRPGQLEKFRPYGIPDKNWLMQVAKSLHNRVTKTNSVHGD